MIFSCYFAHLTLSGMLRLLFFLVLVAPPTRLRDFQNKKKWKNSFSDHSSSKKYVNDLLQTSVCYYQSDGHHDLFTILQESMKIRTALFIVLSVVTMNKLLCLPENIVCARVPHLFACDQPIVLLLLQWNFEISVLSKTFFLTLFFSFSFPPLVWDWPCDENQKKKTAALCGSFLRLFSNCMNVWF